MKILYTGRGYEPSAKDKAIIEEKLEKVNKFLGDLTDAHVIFSVEKYRHTAEIVIQGKSVSFTGSEETDEMYTSIQKVLDKIERQTKKHREKILGKRKKSHKQQNSLPVEELEQFEEDRSDRPPANVIRVDGYDVKPMPLEEAVMQIELTSSDFLVFRESNTDNVNVLFWRKDGNLGLIDIKP